MALAGGFRLAFWSEHAPHHGPRLDRALARYDRYADARSTAFPATAIAAFAHFLDRHTPRQDGPEHGMAYDVQRFNELTKQMSAYAHYTRDQHLQLAAARAQRRDRARQLAEQINKLQLRYRTPHSRRQHGRQTTSRLRATGLRAPRPPSRGPHPLHHRTTRATPRRPRPAPARRPAPRQHRRPLPGTAKS